MRHIISVHPDYRVTFCYYKGNDRVGFFLQEKKTGRPFVVAQPFSFFRSRVEGAIAEIISSGGVLEDATFDLNLGERYRENGEEEKIILLPLSKLYSFVNDIDERTVHPTNVH